MFYSVWLHSDSGDVGERTKIEADSSAKAIEQFRDELHDAGLVEPLDIRARNS